MQYRDGIALTWTNGRKLASLTNGSRTTTFTYDGDGNRIRKAGANDSVDYTVIDGVIYAEKRQAGVTNTLHYLFDENGTRIGFIHNGTDAYYYRFNLQGDVTGIFNASGTLITEYFYDAWGKLEKTTGNYFIGLLNPIRYRGYYFDMETGLYYLNSRYYDPETGRFINADGFVSTGQGILSCNMFVYCLNNPKNHCDPSGERCICLTQRVGPRHVCESTKESSDLANHINKEHLTTPSLMFDLGWLIGKVCFSSTVTKEDEEPGLFYSYSDIGNDKNSMAIGMNFDGILGAEAGFNSNLNIFVKIQVSPWVHGEISVGLDGLGVCIGFDNEDKSYDFEITIGWLFFLALINPGAVSNGQLSGGLT